MQMKTMLTISDPNRRDIRLRELQQNFPGKVLTHPVEMMTYEMDAAIDRGLPDAVLFPESADDVIRAVRWATLAGIPLVARGAGTGLSGGAVAEHGGLIIEFSRLNRILEFDPIGRAVLVEPGLVNLKLDEFVKKAGLYFPPDPASGRSATIGGNLAENAGGPHCFKYGVMTNYVLGMQAVLADGQPIWFGGAAYDYPEYDFAGVLTGSEGTLGIIVQAWLRLMRNPLGVKTMMAAFDSVEAAGQAVSAIIARGLMPATMEFMDRKMMHIIEDYAHAGLPVEAEAALIIEVDGYPGSLQPQMSELLEILENQSACRLRVAETAEERDRIWYGRKSAAGAMARLSPAYYLLDGTVPRSLLAEALAEVNRICQELELRVAYVFHAGDGNLHPFILIENPDDPEVMRRVFHAGESIMQICVERQGSITGEHGVGIEKRQFLSMMYNQDELAAMRDLKSVFDSSGVLNPGKIFPQTTFQDMVFTTVRSEAHPKECIDQFTPTTGEEVVELFRAAQSKGVSIRLRGGGTKSGLLPATDWLLFTKNLNSIRTINPQDLYVTVQSGTALEEMQGVLSSTGMWVPLVSPWRQATIGGMLSTNFNAPLRMRYGGMRDLLLAVTVVLPDGRLVKLGRPVVKNVAGYDLPKLFIGAYGTLGLIIEATLKVIPCPRSRKSLVIPVENLKRGLEIGQKLAGNCLVASALLLISHSHGPKCHELASSVGNSPYYLVYSVEGLPEDVDAELTQVQMILQSIRNSVGTELESVSGNSLWADWLRSAMASPETVWRVGVPPRELANLFGTIPQNLDFLLDLLSGLTWIASSSVDVAAEMPRIRQCAQDLAGYAVLLSSRTDSIGTNNIWGYQPESMELMDRLKSRWDPRKLINPGGFYF